MRKKNILLTINAILILRNFFCHISVKEAFRTHWLTGGIHPVENFVKFLSPQFCKQKTSQSAKKFDKNAFSTFKIIAKEVVPLFSPTSIFIVINRRSRFSLPQTNYIHFKK